MKSWSQGTNSLGILSHIDEPRLMSHGCKTELQIPFGLRPDLTEIQHRRYAARDLDKRSMWYGGTKFAKQCFSCDRKTKL